MEHLLTKRSQVRYCSYSKIQAGEGWRPKGSLPFSYFVLCCIWSNVPHFPIWKTRSTFLEDSLLKSGLPNTQQIRILEVVLNRVLSNCSERMSAFERGNFKNSGGHSPHFPTPQYCKRITFIWDFYRIFLKGISYNYDLRSLLSRVNTSNDFNTISSLKSSGIHFA